MKRTLVLELHSDLCAGVGKHFASMLDLDTALDDYGFPYIPSKRLKGCMREAAEYLCESDTLDSLFGKRGDDKPGALQIGNAIIFPTYKEYYKNIESVRQNNISHVEITDLYCSTREQTSIDENTGTVKDKSLRFIRVVNRNVPESAEPMRFYAPIECCDDSKETTELIGNIANALRNIGYHRNRGLGAVECSLIDADMREFELDSDIVFDDDRDYVLTCHIRLDSDLMLPANDASHSMDYIPGTMVLGTLASKYNGDRFNDVFLSDKVRFGNFYISDALGHKYIPSPRFLAKIKAPSKEEDKGIKNTIGVDVTTAQYKPLKKGYINPDFGYLEPETKIVYHNSINVDDGGLYMQYCLCAGQYYLGEIVAKGSVLRELYPLFADGVLHFGRSKTAQYSDCSMMDLSVREYNRKEYTAEKNSVIAFVLNSDTIITDEAGNYSADKDHLFKAVVEALCVDPNSFDVFDENDLYLDKTSLASKVISGYNAKWNLKKPQITAFAGGSVLIVRAKESMTLPYAFTVGDKQNEGFGSVLTVYNAADYSVCKNKGTKTGDEKTELVSLVEKRRSIEHILGQAVQRAIEINSRGLKALNKAQIGRLSLMCKEAAKIKDFESRIESIKTEKIRVEAERYFSEKAIQTALHISEWKEIQYYIIKVLTVLKYLAGKENQ